MVSEGVTKYVRMEGRSPDLVLVHKDEPAVIIFQETFIQENMIVKGMCAHVESMCSSRYQNGDWRIKMLTRTTSFHSRWDEKKYSVLNTQEGDVCHNANEAGADQIERDGRCREKASKGEKSNWEHEGQEGVGSR